MERFYLGTHQLSWLTRTDVPLFVSAVRFKKRTYPKARGRFGLDSGGFSVLRKYGRWTLTDQEHADDVRRIVERTGRPDFAAPRDMMCEPFMLQMTGGTVRSHQQATIESVLQLRRRAPEVPWLPVLQGWEVGEYLDHVEQYRAAGIDLLTEPVVGVGSVCRRQGADEGETVVRAVAERGIRVHAFGVKIDGLRRYRESVVSADSMAWSFAARRQRVRMEGCSHPVCNNCMVWAMEWRRRVVGDHLQLALPL